MAKRSWKRSLLLTGLALVAVLGLAWVALLVFLEPEDLKEAALARAREATGYEIEAGPASLHLGISGVGLRVEELALVSPDRSQALDAEKLDVYVKLLPLLQKELSLREVVVHRPRLQVDRSLASPVAGEGEVSPAGSPALALLAVDSWEIKDGSYIQEDAEHPLEITGLDLGGSVSWSAEGGAIGHAGGSIGSVRFGSPGASTAIPSLRARAEFAVDPGLGAARLTGLELETGELRLGGELSLLQEPAGWSGRADLRVDPISWEDLQGILPPEALARLEGMTIAGRFEMPELQVEFGPGPAPPRVAGRLSFQEVRLRTEKAPMGLSEFAGEMSLTAEGIELPRASGRLGEETLVLSASLEGLPPRRGSAHVTTRVPAVVLDGFLPAGSPLGLETGAVNLDVGARFELPPAGIPDLTGTIELDELGGSFRTLPMRHTRGTFRFEGRGAKVEALHTEIGRSDVTLQGTLADLREPWLRFTLESERLDLDELFPPETGEEKEEEGGAVGAPGEGTLRVGELVTRGWRLQEVRGHARLAPEGIDLTNITARLYGGGGKGDLHLVPLEGGRWRYTGQVAATEVRVGDLLADRFPAAQVLEGQLRFDADLNGRTGETGFDAWRALSMVGDLEVLDGALRNQPQLEALGKMLGLGGVSRDHWPFERLLTAFKVEEGNFIIEPLRLRQPGVAWTMTGKVGPGGGLALDGALQVDPARAKLPPEVQALSRYLVDDEGRIPIDFRVGGRLAAPDIQVDREALFKRATDRAKAEQANAARKKIEQSIPDSTGIGGALNRILGGGNKKP